MCTLIPRYVYVTIRLFSYILLYSIENIWVMHALQDSLNTIVINKYKFEVCLTYNHNIIH